MSSHSKASLIQCNQTREQNFLKIVLIHIVIIMCMYLHPLTCAWGYLWHSNTDKIGKLKYMVKLESDIYIFDHNLRLTMYLSLII